MGGRGGSVIGKGRYINNKSFLNQNSRYKEFEDTAVSSSGWGGFEYTGDGSEQVAWFKQNSNAYELIQKMNGDEREAFLAWARGEFMDGQQYKGWDKMSHYEQELTRHYDNILDKATLKRGVVVTRDTTAELILGKGHKTATLEQLRAAEGSIVTSKGSMSAGAAKTGLSIGDSSKQVRVRIQIPAGAKGAGMWIADKRIHGWGLKQLEFMTNRDSVFKVGKTVYDATSGKYIVNVKWIGREEHDYGKKRKK